ncbi:MAG: hypothetical protein GX299_08550 [Epulopiscium sp.]|nr:hypothetical protein [Candidatus Epulonipiscium sp.]
MIVKLTMEQIDDVYYGNGLIVNEEKWMFVEQTFNNVLTDRKDGKYEHYIYKRLSDNKFFMITLYFEKYGADSYGYHVHFQDGIAREVKEESVTKTVWVEV